MSLKQIVPPFIDNIYFNLKMIYYFQKYKKIVSKNKLWQNKFKGERCFLLGSGPSVLSQNLKLIKDDNLFFLNNFCVHKDFKLLAEGNGTKFTVIAPVHKPQEDSEWLEWLRFLDNKNPKEMNFFLGLNYYKSNINYLKNKYNLFSGRSLNWYFAGRRF
jgi:hypothetical protein